MILRPFICGSSWPGFIGTLLLGCPLCGLMGCSLVPEPNFMTERRRQQAACERALKYGWCEELTHCKRKPSGCSGKQLRIPAAIAAGGSIAKTDERKVAKASR